MPSPLPGPGLPPERQDTKSLLLKLGRGGHWLNSTATTTPLYNHLERPYPKGDVVAHGVIDECRWWPWGHRPEGGGPLAPPYGGARCVSARPQWGGRGGNGTIHKFKVGKILYRWSVVSPFKAGGGLPPARGRWGTSGCRQRGQRVAIGAFHVHSSACAFTSHSRQKAWRVASCRGRCFRALRVQ